MALNRSPGLILNEILKMDWICFKLAIFEAGKIQQTMQTMITDQDHPQTKCISEKQYSNLANGFVEGI